jgi:hypothetical protein
MVRVALLHETVQNLGVNKLPRKPSAMQTGFIIGQGKVRRTYAGGGPLRQRRTGSAVRALVEGWDR